MKDKWKVNCGWFQIILSFIALIVTVIATHLFIPLEKIMLDNLHIEQIDIIIGVLIFIIGILTSSVIATTGYVNIMEGDKNDTKENISSNFTTDYGGGVY